MMETLEGQFEACIICGSIGDAWGSSFENEYIKDDSRNFYLGKKPEITREWNITDDTQLTLATCEALMHPPFDPAFLTAKFLEYYRKKILTGFGASTLKAILDFEAGIHYTQIGRAGEYAAGNGAAMRIAPLAFFSRITKRDVFNACRITHRNDEAYAGALAVYLSIKAVLENKWDGYNNLLEIIIPDLPDTNVKDRLLEINSLAPDMAIKQVAELGNNGYVVNSIPFAIFSAMKVKEIGLTQMYSDIIATGGDTDTNASIAGQIAGVLIGKKEIPAELIKKLRMLKDYDCIAEIIGKTKEKISQQLIE